MHEIFPIAAGLLVGALITRQGGWRAVILGAAAAVLVGFTATLISGEYQVGWEFLAIDIPGAALAIAAGWTARRMLERRTLRRWL